MAPLHLRGFALIFLRESLPFSALAILPLLSYTRLMKSLTIRLPETLMTEIERESRARRVSKSDVVRERLEQPGRATATAGDMSEMMGDILERSWKAKVPAGPPRFRSLHKQKLAGIIRAKKLHR